MADSQPKKREDHSIGEVLGEIGSSAKDLIQSEVDLARAEMRELAIHLGRTSAQTAFFGALLMMSVLPFFAFLVIGLGKALDGNYWLSSLIVSVVCAAVGGVMTYRAYQKIKQQDLTLPRTRESLQYESDAVAGKAQELKETATEGVHDIRSTTKRRIS